MTVCIDTNVLVQLFGRRAPFRPIRGALFTGNLALALSNEVLLEYEEVVTDVLGRVGWARVTAVFDLMASLYENVIFAHPQFRFAIIANDPDDNKFCDCAIAANADYVITEDRHYAPLATAGYHPKPITPQDFISRVLPQLQS